MKILNEDYGQSTDLDEFDSQARGRFDTYWKVILEIKETYNARNSRYQTELFAFEDAARDYYNKLLEDIEEEKYDWYHTNVQLIEVKVNLTEEELEEKDFWETDEEEEEEIVEDDFVEEDEE